MTSTSTAWSIGLVRSSKLVGIPDPLPVYSLYLRSTWSSLQEHGALVVRVDLSFAVTGMAGFGSGYRLSFHSFFGNGAVFRHLRLQLVNCQAVSILSFLASNGIAELLQALSSDGELGSNVLLGLMVGKEYEGREGGIRVALLVDDPQDVVEEWLEIDWD